MQVAIEPMQLNAAGRINELSMQLGYSISVAETERCIDLILNRNEDIALVAVLNKLIVGWIHAFIAYRIETKPFIEIGGLVVHEDYQGKGVGKLLLRP